MALEAWQSCPTESKLFEAIPWIWALWACQACLATGFISIVAAAYSAEMCWDVWESWASMWEETWQETWHDIWIVVETFDINRHYHIIYDYNLLQYFLRLQLFLIICHHKYYQIIIAKSKLNHSLSCAVHLVPCSCFTFWNQWNSFGLVEVPACRGKWRQGPFESHVGHGSVHG